ncbi:MAG TPA: 4Fe-4S binding protein [Spirochaetia bacterium]|nr:4Fe-4S binding protein [Spirochaetia bacterium]
MALKQTIREFIRNLGVDDVGFASVADYHSPRSPKVESFFPGAKSIIVVAYKELSTCESPHMQLAMNGRLDRYAVVRYNSYLICHFLENEFQARVLSIPGGYTVDLTKDNPKGVSDFSLRHAAIAAGLGNFGRHNLVIHPTLGTRVTFSAIITNLEMESDSKATQDFCTHCNICVDNCPAGALNEEGLTDLRKCMSVSQPFGANSFLLYLDKFTNSGQEEKTQMLTSFSFLPFYQALSGAREYNCFNCLKLCPALRDNSEPLQKSKMVG